jgi:hypothetical protein
MIMIPLLSKSRRYDPNHGYAPVGRCIYCGTDQGLTREHIIPLGLSGDRTLPQASCVVCAKITGEIEKKCLRDMLRPIRTRLGMRSRRKKERPDKLPLHIVRDGRHVTHYLPIKDYPTILGMLSFDQPRFLSGKPPQEDKGGLVAPGLYGLNIDVKSYIAEYTKKHGGSGLSFGPIQPGLYARMLAKIAHAYTVAEYGVDSFSPFLIELILSGTDDPFNLVGGDLDDPGTKIHVLKTDDLHAIMIDEREIRGKRCLVVTIQLFACLNAPIYSVVVGEI